ncbi:hypothetical protein ABTE36_21390, partial [Acinetobacter baumannii]
PTDPFISPVEPPPINDMMKILAGQAPLLAVARADSPHLQDLLLSCSWETLRQMPEAFSWQSEDLFRRFLYLRIFSKLFFGPGFAHFSL